MGERWRHGRREVGRELSRRGQGRGRWGGLVWWREVLGRLGGGGGGRGCDEGVELGSSEDALLEEVVEFCDVVWRLLGRVRRYWDRPVRVRRAVKRRLLVRLRLGASLGAVYVAPATRTVLAHAERHSPHSPCTVRAWVQPLVDWWSCERPRTLGLLPALRAGLAEWRPPVRPVGGSVHRSSSWAHSRVSGEEGEEGEDERQGGKGSEGSLVGATHGLARTSHAAAERPWP